MQNMHQAMRNTGAFLLEALGSLRETSNANATAYATFPNSGIHQPRSTPGISDDGPHRTLGQNGPTDD